MSDLSAALDAVAQFARRFVVLDEDELTAVALWVAHTHAVDSFDTTPYLSVTSAEKRSGKTRLLEVLELLVRAPMVAANMSDAALFRSVAQRKPTLLFDEIDAIFGSRTHDREDLRGMLNAGFRRGALTYRMGGSGNTELVAFPVFCPKAFAGIGELPDTIADRSIGLRLQRRTREEPIERFRRRDAEATAELLRGSLENLIASIASPLEHARPDLPNELDDRAQDVWEPLLAIADLAANGWSARARKASLALSCGEAREDESLGVRLLHDIQAVFEATRETRMRTADLIQHLSAIEESPWGDWHGKPITPQKFASMLKPYRIRTMEIWVDGAKARGYKLDQFEETFARVLGGRGGRSGRSESTKRNTPTAPTGPTIPQAEELSDAEIDAAFERLYPGPHSNIGTPAMRRELVLDCLQREQERRLQ